jgi:2-dehydropantoate 2-reductase
VQDVAASDDPGVVLTGATLVLVCVKSGDTGEMARLIAAHSPAAQVISLQNGVANAGTLRTALTGADVRAGTVPFNVVTRAPGHYHRASSGDILVEAGPLPDLSQPCLHWRSVQDIEAIQWGKLLLNLGNAVNALADMPLLEQLQDRAWRRLIADQMAEALRVLKAAGITPARTIDAQARSSMWNDLEQRRKTEVDALQGAILHLADRLGRQAPLNARMRSLIRAAEEAGNGPPGLSPGDIRG